MVLHSLENLLTILKHYLVAQVFVSQELTFVRNINTRTVVFGSRRLLHGPGCQASRQLVNEAPTLILVIIRVTYRARID